MTQSKSGVDFVFVILQLNEDMSFSVSTVTAAGHIIAVNGNGADWKRNNLLLSKAGACQQKKPKEKLESSPASIPR